MSNGTIYVSHTEDATGRAATLIAQLGDANLTVWSRRTTPRGTRWQQRIANCDVFLVCCVSGAHARDEVALAQDAARSLIVVLLDDGPVPAELLGFFTVAAYADSVRAVDQIRSLFRSGEQRQTKVRGRNIAGGSIEIKQFGGGEADVQAEGDIVDTNWVIQQGDQRRSQS